FLAADRPHVGFNGNKYRAGRGYLLDSPGGWLAKAGYPAGDVKGFLADLAGLAGPLVLTVVGVARGDAVVRSLTDLRALASADPRALERYHVRVYTAADYVNRWNAEFGWSAFTALAASPGQVSAGELIQALERKHIRRHELARGIGKDASFVS